MATTQITWKSSDKTSYFTWNLEPSLVAVEHEIVQPWVIQEVILRRWFVLPGIVPRQGCSPPSWLQWNWLIWLDKLFKASIDTYFFFKEVQCDKTKSGKWCLSLAPTDWPKVTLRWEITHELLVCCSPVSVQVCTQCPVVLLGVRVHSSLAMAGHSLALTHPNTNTLPHLTYST